MGNTTLGGLIRSLREAADLSQEELAARAGVSRGSIQNWEGDLRKPRRAEFRRLASALGTTAAELSANAAGDHPDDNGDDGDNGPGSGDDEVRRLRAEVAALRAEIKRLSGRKRRTVTENDAQNVADTDS
jgi:transcriptional regulator with XRE-family HTH domain